jgi:hypothetical protein
MTVRQRWATQSGGIALGAIVVSWFVVGVAFADHLQWMKPHRTYDGKSCCGDTDCVPATVVAGPDGQVIVNGAPLRLPSGSVHPVPEDVDTGWWCYQGHASCQPPTLEISAAWARCVFFRRTLEDI